MKQDRPPQIENVLEEVKKFVYARNFRFSKHAISRAKERSISPQDAVYILTNGFHEKKKTTFDPDVKTWKYAIRGKTVDNLEIRVIVALINEIIIITVIRLCKKRLWKIKK